MAATGFTPIIVYNSGTATNVPSSGNLAFGELALNYADGKLYYKNSGGVVTSFSSGSGLPPALNINLQQNFGGF